MRAPLLCLSLLAATAACGHGPSTGADAAITADAHGPDAPRGPDAAFACSAIASSTVVANGQAFDFAALGNVDVGNESSCGGPPEGVEIELSVTPDRSDISQLASILLKFPIATGSQSVTVIAGSGHTQWSATLDVTQVIVDGAGPALSLVEGTLSGSVTGHFTAAHCASLDVSCI